MTDIQAFEKPPGTVRAAISDLPSSKPCGDGEDEFDHWRITKRGRPSAYAKLLRSNDGCFTSQRMVEHKREVARRFASVAQGETDALGRHPKLSWDGHCSTLRAGNRADQGPHPPLRPPPPTS